MTSPPNKNALSVPQTRKAPNSRSSSQASESVKANPSDGYDIVRTYSMRPQPIKSVPIDHASAIEKMRMKSERHCELEHDVNLEVYEKILSEAKKLTGHGAKAGSFPEEWAVQVLVHAGHTVEGYKIVVFTPAFLQPVLGDPHELDKAFKFIVHHMHQIATKGKYVFVYCHSGFNWANPDLAHRLRLAYDILPKPYCKHLRRFYILHPTGALRFFLNMTWPILTTRLWDAIELVDSLEDLCNLLQPNNAVKREEVRKCFPHYVQREDAVACELPVPTTFGVPLRQLCDTCSIDFVDRTTWRLYSRLPPALIFLCEALERHGGDEAFPQLFEGEDASSIYDLVAIVDSGFPLDPDLPDSALWCALKLFLDCLPAPVLTYGAFDELERRALTTKDTKGHRRFLLDALHHKVPEESACVATYLASFFLTMCKRAEERNTSKRRNQDSTTLGERSKSTHLTPKRAAEVFAASFLRPRKITDQIIKYLPVAVAIVEALISSAEDPDIWIGNQTVPAKHDSDDEDGASTTDMTADSGADI